MRISLAPFPCSKIYGDWLSRALKTEQRGLSWISSLQIIADGSSALNRRYIQTHEGQWERIESQHGHQKWQKSTILLFNIVLSVSHVRTHNSRSNWKNFNYPLFAGIVKNSFGSRSFCVTRRVFNVLSGLLIRYHFITPFFLILRFSGLRRESQHGGYKPHPLGQTTSQGSHDCWWKVWFIGLYLNRKGRSYPCAIRSIWNQWQLWMWTRLMWPRRMWGWACEGINFLSNEHQKSWKHSQQHW